MEIKFVTLRSDEPEDKEHLQQESAGEARIETTSDGTEFLVVPAVPIRGGIFNRTLIPSSVLDRFVTNPINGTPVLMPGHPLKPVSPSEEATAAWQFGTVRNAKFDADTGRILAEYWLWLDKLRRGQFEWIIDAALLGTNAFLENSIGAFMETMPVDNESFDEVVNFIAYDHVAILIGPEGACSIEDGCGAGNGRQFNNSASVTAGDNNGGIMSHKDKDQKSTDEDTVMLAALNETVGELSTRFTDLATEVEKANTFLAQLSSREIDAGQGEKAKEDGRGDVDVATAIVNALEPLAKSQAKLLEEMATMRASGATSVDVVENQEKSNDDIKAMSLRPTASNGKTRTFSIF
jgi:hypothetical protein